MNLSLFSLVTQFLEMSVFSCELGKKGESRLIMTLYVKDNYNNTHTKYEDHAKQFKSRNFRILIFKRRFTAGGIRVRGCYGCCCIRGGCDGRSIRVAS